MEDQEKLLAALAWMSVQYLEQDGVLDHEFMSAGEQAMAILAERGLISNGERGATWTEQGKAFLMSH